MTLNDPNGATGYAPVAGDVVQLLQIGETLAVLGRQ